MPFQGLQIDQAPRRNLDEPHHVISLVPIGYRRDAMDEDLSRPGTLPRRDATRPDDYIRAEDRNWGVLPILLGAAIIVLLGFLIFSPGFGPTADRAVTSQRELPNTAPSAP